VKNQVGLSVRAQYVRSGFARHLKLDALRGCDSSPLKELLAMAVAIGGDSDTFVPNC